MRLTNETVELRKRLLPFLGCAALRQPCRCSHLTAAHSAGLAAEALPAPHSDTLPVCLTCPACSMFTCDTGGLLSRVVHLYHYNDFDHRDKHRAMTATNKEWQVRAG